MGTRNLTCVVLDKKFVVAQYCQWDGYPEGQGATIVDFITKEMDIKKFRKALRELKHPTEKQITKKIEKATNLKLEGKEWINMDEADKIKKAYPQYYRDMGAKVLKAIQDGSVKEVRMDLDFAADSLFCEWAYVLDMDKKVFEVYRGFNQKPLKKGERFENLKKCEYNGDIEYYPIRLKKKYKFAEASKLLKDAKK